MLVRRTHSVICNKSESLNIQLDDICWADCRGGGEGGIARAPFHKCDSGRMDGWIGPRLIVSSRTENKKREMNKGINEL